MTVSTQWQQYAHQLDSLSASQTNLQWQHAWQQLLRLNGLVRQWLSQLEACVLLPAFCHRDLTPHNLLLSGHQSQRLLCIDYEYAVASHPLFDLASVIATHELSSRQVNQLVDGIINGRQRTTKIHTIHTLLYKIFYINDLLICPDNVQIR